MQCGDRGSIEGAGERRNSVLEILISVLDDVPDGGADNGWLGHAVHCGGDDVEIDAGEAAGVSSAEMRELRELRKKNRELEQTIEILKAATTFFARECDPLHR